MQSLTIIRTVFRGAAACLAGLGTPALMSGQQSIRQVQVTAPAVARADSLHALAATMDGSPSRYAMAVRLHEESAALRQPQDPRASTCLRSAAVLLYFSGHRDAAVAVMERAAASAMARGDVVTAVNAYIDAGVVAAELGHADKATELGRKAQVLTSSPLLSSDQRVALQDRMTATAHVAMLKRP